MSTLPPRGGGKMSEAGKLNVVLVAGVLKVDLLGGEMSEY